MLTLKATGELKNLERLLAALVKYERGRGIPEAVGARLNLVVEELFVNFVNHGRPEGKGRFEVTVAVQANEVRCQVRDNGCSFNPSESRMRDEGPLDTRSVGGLGLFLTQQMVSSMSYERDGDVNVTTICLPVEGSSG